LQYQFHNASWAWAAGGVVSTPEDLAIWIKALTLGKLFNAKFYQHWLGSFVAIDKKQIIYYGYGIAKIIRDKSPTVFFHNGQLPGYNTYAMYYPDKNIIAIFWSNLGVNLDGIPPSDELMMLVYQQVFLKNLTPLTSLGNNTNQEK